VLPEGIPVPKCADLRSGIRANSPKKAFSRGSGSASHSGGKDEPATGHSALERNSRLAPTPGREKWLMTRLWPYLLVGTGAFIGGNARYILAKWVGGIMEGRFPLGTFVINASGSFILGFLAGWLMQRNVPNADSLRLALGVGFCGGFTTFSTFAFETHALFEDGVWLGAITNMLLSLFAGLLAVRLGILAGKSWF
jgi:CrcB protein